MHDSRSLPHRFCLPPQIEEAAKVANCHDFISAFPQVYPHPAHFLTLRLKTNAEAGLSAGQA